jgi:hypothetical protein
VTAGAIAVGEILTGGECRTLILDPFDMLGRLACGWFIANFVRIQDSMVIQKQCGS